MTTLEVEVRDFVDAADLMYDDIAQPVRSALGRLSVTLAGCGAMAGDDEGGRGWAGAYDDSASAVVAATHVFATAALQTAHLFGRSACNYAAAERAATAGASAPGPPPWSLGSTSLPPIDAPPSAAGGGGDEPTAWGLIKHLVGYVWPNGHQDKLRRAAAEHRFCAETLESVAGKPMIASIPFHVHRLPEADDIITVCRGLSNRATELARAHRQLAESCDDLAHHLDRCHSEVESELVELAAESAAIQTIGAVLSVFTFGAAEVPTQAVQTARLAAVAGRVTELIRRFVTAVRILDAAVTRVGELARQIKLSLDGLAGARLVYAGVTQVPQTARVSRMAEKGGEAAAAGRLAQSAERVAHLPARLVGRKPGDPGVWGDPRTLAEHFGNHGAEVNATSEADYARKASDFLERALRKGLPRRIDSRGNIRIYDPSTRLFGSYRSDGSTRTFFRPTSPTYFERQPGVLQ